MNYQNQISFHVEEQFSQLYSQIYWSNVQNGIDGINTVQWTFDSLEYVIDYNQNIESNPIFCNPNDGNFGLSIISPAMNASENSTYIGYTDYSCDVAYFNLPDLSMDVLGNSGMIDISNELVILNGLNGVSLEFFNLPGNLFFSYSNGQITYSADEDLFGEFNFQYSLQSDEIISDTANISLTIFYENEVKVYETQGDISGGVTMLDPTSIYVVSSNDAVYRLDEEFNYYYNLNVGGEINSASTITNDHNIYIASTDNNLYSFNAAGVTNPNWPRAMGSELTASVTLDSLDNLYLGTSNGIFQAVTPDNQTLWSYNLGAPVYSSAVINKNNILVVCTLDGRVFGFNLNSLNPQIPSFDWLRTTGSEIKSSPALDDDGNVYVVTMDSELIKINASDGQIIWRYEADLSPGASDIGIDMEQYSVGALIDAEGNVIFCTFNGIINKVSPNGVLLFQTILEDSFIFGSPALDSYGNLYVSYNDYENIDYGIVAFNDQGDIFSKFSGAIGEITCPLLVNENSIYFGTLAGNTYKVEFDLVDISVRDRPTSGLPGWGTFQGNNQRTGYQGRNNLSNSNENKFNLPIVYKLHQNYPNPFNPTTRISYDLPENEFVSINVFDLRGREVKTLVNKEQVAGFRSVKWDATNNLGQPVSAGMYIYTIQAGEFRQTRKMVLLK